MSYLSASYDDGSESFKEEYCRHLFISFLSIQVKRLVTKRFWEIYRPVTVFVWENIQIMRTLLWCQLEFFDVMLEALSCQAVLIHLSSQHIIFEYRNDAWKAEEKMNFKFFIIVFFIMSWRFFNKNNIFLVCLPIDYVKSSVE